MARERPAPERYGTALLGAALLAVAGAAWVAVLGQAGMIAPGPGPAEGMALAGGGLAPALAFMASWLVMMAAMMLPSAAPMMLLCRAVARRRVPPGRAALHSGLFLAMYLLVWGGFGLVVYLAHGGLALAARASRDFAAALPYGGVAALVLAGLYQLTPLKSACLRQCRSPLDFLMTRWRSGLRGALRLGAEHGLYCLGCCWGLMVVLVAAGAMGLAWVALITLVVFVEKLLPRGEAAARVVGALLLTLGVLVALRPEVAALLRAATLGGGCAGGRERPRRRPAVTRWHWHPAPLAVTRRAWTRRKKPRR